MPCFGVTSTTIDIRVPGAMTMGDSAAEKARWGVEPRDNGPIGRRTPVGRLEARSIGVRLCLRRAASRYQRRRGAALEARRHGHDQQDRPNATREERRAEHRLGLDWQLTGLGRALAESPARGPSRRPGL